MRIIQFLTLSLSKGLTLSLPKGEGPRFRLKVFCSDVKILALGRADGFVVANHFPDHKGEKFFREVGIELGLNRKGAEPGDLGSLTLRISRRQIVLGLVDANRLRAFEPLRQQMDQRRIDIVNAVPEPQ